MTLDNSIYKQLFKQCVVGFLVCDRSKNIIAVNPHAARLLGYTQSELKDQQIDKVFPKQLVNRISRKLTSKKKRFFFAETLVNKKDQTTVEVEIHANRVESQEHVVMMLVVRDVSHHKHEANALKEKNAQILQVQNELKTAQKLARIGSYLLDIESGKWTSSDVLDKLFGINKKSVRTVRTWISLIHPDEKKEMLAYLLHEVIGKKNRFDKEYRIIRRTDKSVRWVHGLGKLIFDDHNNPIQMFGTIQDITEQKEREQKLAKFSQLVEQSKEGMAIADLEGAIIFVNKAWCQMHGYTSAKALIGKNLEIFHSKKQFIEEVKPFNTIVMKRGSNSGEMGHKKKNGDLFTALMTTTLLKDSNQIAFAIAGTAIDITQQRAIQDQLKESEEKYATIIERSNDGIIVLQDKKIQFVNAMAMHIIGYDKKDLIGKEFLKFIDPNDQERVVKNYVRRLKGEDVKSRYEFNLVLKNGEKVLVEVNASQVRIGGKVGVMAILRDVTKDNEVKRLKQEFLSLASHQMRTPLTGIKWAVEILRKGKIGPLTEKQKEMVDQIEISSLRMIALVDDLLDVSRIDNKETEALKKDNCNVCSLLQSVVNEMQILIDEKELTLVMNPCGNCSASLWVDEKKIRQAFQNILSNAIKYTPRQKRIAITGKKIGKEIVYAIQDEGVGIPENQQKQVFQKFFRADNVVTTTGGTGLGLYLSKDIIEKHGGRIWFESEEGKGTTFYIALPIKKMMLNT
ncbi:hypothetical protein COV05_00300 [Candidatus Uhrbacteria bacterium CG10_big_fil_rev_8_21_14_0_10_48_16]|uniref:histidine kinase n=1 Tax=Candidatus Uhrbacteria bacterium CG10_big_fil_rev_8_21_14_0_10_48_16 TaxID=1975038 RepID=A0A2M8LIH7_9BACT|nr:MAG: hypothetical protein COV05_00300 [Candidatus Uhrbacteria bacterium CG10_big_fil_rev_8_21_14_0_10_48_16]